MSAREERRHRGRRQVHAEFTKILLLTTVLSTASIVFLSLTEPATAQATARNFNIAPQPLASALREFANQSGMQLAYRTTELRGMNSPGFQGSASNTQALARLLAGTGVSYNMSGANTVTIQRSAATAGGPMPAGAISLDTIDVQGAGNPNALIGPPPAPYAGGQVARGSRMGVLGNMDFMSTPFNATSFTKDFTNNVGAFNLSDVLRYSPSVQSSSSGPNNITDAIYLRGFWAGASSVAIDGFSGLGFRRAELAPIERVELVLGPTTFLYGQPLSVGGMINMVPKRAGDQPLTSVGFQWMTRSVLNRFFDVGRRFGENNEWGVRVNGSWSSGELPISQTYRDIKIGSLALDYRSERFRWTFDYIHHDREVPAEAWFFADVGVPLPRARDASREFQPKWATYGSTQQIALTRAELDLNENWTASVGFGHSWMNDRRKSQVYVLTDALGTLDPQWGASKYRGQFQDYSAEAMLRGQFDTGPVQHRVRLGATQIGGNAKGAGEGIAGVGISNIYAPTYPADPYIPDPVLPAHFTSKNKLSTLFVSDQMGMLDDRLQFIVGARNVRYIYDSLDGVTGGLTDRYTEGALTPAYAVVVKPLSWLSLYANLVEALEPGYRVDTTAANANAMLPPARTNQKEVGVKTDFGSIAATVSAFEIKMPYVYRDPSTNIEAYNGNQVNRGIEFNLFGEAVKGVRLLGGATLLDASLHGTEGGLTDGNRPSGVPKYTVVSHVDWDIPGVAGLAMRAGLLYTGSVYADTTNTQLAPSWTRFDTGIRYGFKAGASDVMLHFNVDNLLDTRYFQVERGTIYSAAGRIYRLSAVAKF
jgi:iron complex outermembrane receptor protein